MFKALSKVENAIYEYCGWAYGQQWEKLVSTFVPSKLNCVFCHSLNKAGKKT